MDVAAVFVVFVVAILAMGGLYLAEKYLKHREQAEEARRRQTEISNTLMARRLRERSTYNDRNMAEYNRKPLTPSKETARNGPRRDDHNYGASK